jgi:hypothetical protein
MNGLEQKQELTLEEQLDDIRYDIREIRATQSVLVNYIQLLVEERGLAEKAAHLEEQIREIRALEANR